MKVMKEIKKVMITGDIFRANKFGEPSQDININWLYQILQNPIKLAASCEVNKVLFSKKKDSLTNCAYEMIGEEVSIDAWAKLFYLNNFNNEFLQHIWLQFRQAIVVAFELPEILRVAFEQLGIIYVDIIIHPIRFLDDVIFGIRSNNIKISETLQNYMLSEEKILLNAGIVMASMSRLKRLEIPGSAVIFAGQTADDKVLIEDGKFLKISDFLDNFSQITRDFDTLIIKPHPYSSNPFEAISISRLFDRCLTTNENFYYLLSHDNIEAVYSISSSTSVEANYLGKQGYHFAQYPFNFAKKWEISEFKKGSFIPIDDVILSADFWRNILDPILSTTAPTGYQLPKKPNRIRTSLRNFWGFNFVDTDIICQLYDR